MKTLPTLACVLLFLSCTPPSQRSETTDSLTTTTTTSDTVTLAPSEECVFDDDYQGLTEAWLAELKITDFVWRDDLKQAHIARGQDTVVVAKGGCVHFNVLVEYKFTNDNHAPADSAYFIAKALELATEFDLENYRETIRRGYFKKTRDGESVLYEIDDDDLEDNQYYNGIEITTEGKGRRISMSLYMN